MSTATTTTTTATATATGAELEGKPGGALRQYSDRFFSRSEMCLQLWPTMSTSRGRNTLGLWMVGAPLVLLLLIKGMTGWPHGLFGWVWLLIVAAAFALLGAGFMEWGLSPDGDAAKVPRDAWIYMGVGGGVLTLILLVNLGMAVGRATKQSRAQPTTIVASSSD